MTFEVLDIIALIVLLVAALRAMFKGFVKEFMAKAGILIGFLGALMFSSLLAGYLDDRFALGNWSNIISFILLFAAGFLLSQIAASTVRSVLEGLHLAFLDNILGFLLGLLEGAVLISFAVYILRLQTVLDVEMFLTQSRVVEFLEPIAPYGIELFDSAVKEEKL
ncbi:MAG: CvpA family protein [Spirochaetia bacterium]|nr:CvpA family protein [Spirochaetia bacterium]